MTFLSDTYGVGDTVEIIDPPDGWGTHGQVVGVLATDGDVIVDRPGYGWSEHHPVHLRLVTS